MPLKHLHATYGLVLLWDSGVHLILKRKLVLAQLHATSGSFWSELFFLSFDANVDQTVIGLISENDEDECAWRHRQLSHESQATRSWWTEPKFTSDHSWIAIVVISSIFNFFFLRFVFIELTTNQCEIIADRQDVGRWAWRWPPTGG